MKKLKMAAACFCGLVLSGCSAVSFTVDGLLNAPKLTEEQSEIHQALIASVGSNITLKYPKSGENRSAYVIANIDNEPDNEALVFYEYNSGDIGDDGLRVNVLDKDENGKWYSVKELAGAGTDIDRVIISPMGDYNHIDVLVGYQTIAGEDKTLEIYSYRDGDFKRVGLDTYSVLETLDINSDGYNELITIERIINAETGSVTAKASLLYLDENANSADSVKPGGDENPTGTENPAGGANLTGGEIVKEDGIDMCSNVVSYAASVTGLLNKEHEAIFIDGVNADGNLQTEIVYYRYSSLQNPMQISSDKLLPMCTRPMGYYSSDMDGDGIVEIPSTQPMTGYENAISDEMIYLTSWNVYEDFFSLEEKYRGYYALSDGYFFAFPNRWRDLVTVKRDNETGEAVFYKYSGDINSSMEEVMRIAVSSKNTSDDYVNDGYSVIDSKGQLDYLVKLPADKREQLILTIDEVQNNFHIVE